MSRICGADGGSANDLSAKVLKSEKHRDTNSGCDRWFESRSDDGTLSAQVVESIEY